MANTNAPFGFTQRKGTGSVPTMELVALRNGGIAYNAAAIYFGDPVVRVGSGASTITQALGGQGAGTGSILAGIFYGCKYLSTAAKRTVWSNYWPGSDVSSANQSTIEAYICNDPNAQFTCQSDSTGLVQADVGANFDFNIGTGTTANGLSGAYLLHGGSTTAYPFRLIELVDAPPGSPGTASGAYNRAVVAFNNVETKNSTAVNT